MKKKKDEKLIEKLLNIKNSKKLSFLFKSSDNKKAHEIKELQKIKKRIKAVKTIEELEELELELEKLGIIDRNEIERLKKKKKKRLERDSLTFRERIRCDDEIIKQLLEVRKTYERKERIRQEKEQIQNRDERLKEGQKDKEKDKEKGERTRSGGRSRGRGAR